MQTWGRETTNYYGEMIYTRGCLHVAIRGGAHTGIGEQDCLHTVAPKDVQEYNFV